MNDIETRNTAEILSNIEPATIEDVKALLDCGAKGEIRSSIDNCVIILRCDPLLKGSICFNSLTERIDIIKDLGWQKSTTMLSDTDMDHIIYYFEKNYGISRDKTIIRACHLIADENRFHPIQRLLKSLTWDSEKRIDNALHHFLGADQSDYVGEAMRLFMLGAINRVFHPGCKFDYMLCLVGGQGAGKSTFFRMLAMTDEYFTDDVRNIDDDKIYTRMQGHWIIEMSEMLAAINAKSVEDLKSFISRTKETYRTPYATQPQDRLRQCVFGGTTNSVDFLPMDRTGNRRFIPIQIKAEEAECHILDDEEASRDYIRQMWAEAMVIYESGDYSLVFEKELSDYLKEHQQDFMPEDTQAGMIADFLEKQVVKGYTFTCSKQLYHEALGYSDKPKQWELREINSIMNNNFPDWRKVDNPQTIEPYGRQKGWEKIPDVLPDKDGFIPVTEQMECPFL